MKLFAPSPEFTGLILQSISVNFNQISFHSLTDTCPYYFLFVCKQATALCCLVAMLFFVTKTEPQKLIKFQNGQGVGVLLNVQLDNSILISFMITISQ